MIIDPVNALTTTAILNAKGQSASVVNSAALDISNYVGKLAVIVNTGPKSAGDASPTLDVRLMSSATSNFSNAANISGANIATVTNSNNTQVIALDTRVASRYVYAVSTVTGTNGVLPVSVVAVGTLKVQP